MAGATKRPDATRTATEHDRRSVGANLVVAGHELFVENGHEPAGVVVYVLGGGAVGVDRNPAQRDLPLVTRQKGESDAAHLARFVHHVDAAMAAGGTHLLVPREHAGWLGDRPLVADYFAQHHALAEASAETGIVFEL